MKLEKKKFAWLCGGLMALSLLAAGMISAEEPMTPISFMTDEDLRLLVAQSTDEVPVSIQLLTYNKRRALYEVSEGIERRFVIVSQLKPRKDGEPAKPPALSGVTTKATCSAQCSSGTLSCCTNPEPAFCSATNFSGVVCDNTSVSCATYDAWNGCFEDAFDDFDTCRLFCPFRDSCFDDCLNALGSDLAACGSNPSSSTC